MVTIPAAAAASTAVTRTLVVAAATVVNEVDAAVEPRPRQRGDVDFRSDAFQAQNRLPRE